MTGLRTWTAALAGAFALVPMAAAQDAGTSDEIIVTAQKRAQNVQDVPIAVTALSSDTLEDQHVTSVMGLNNIAPSLQIKAADNAANPKIFIRGVGLNDFNPNTASAVAIYTDGVYIGSPLAQMSQFLDLERVEVLRGPQGTLYGRNTTGGAINVISRRPTFDWTSNASVDLSGDYGAATVEGAIGGPIIADVLAFRIAGTYVNDSGYTYNRFTGRDGNDADRGSVRASLLWTPSENFEGLFQVRYGDAKGGSILAYNRSLLPGTLAATGPDGFCDPGFYTSGQCTDVFGYANTSSDLYAGDYNVEGKDLVETYGASATLTWDLGNVSLVSVTGYDQADRDDLEDTDASPNDLITARYLAQQWAASQEVRVQSNGDGPANWVLGAYYAHDDLETASSYDLTLALGAVVAWPFTQSTDSYAVFGQLDYDLTERLTATIGLRYSQDSKSLDYTALTNGAVAFAFNDSEDFSSLSGRLGLQYALSDDVNVYASYNRGYKSGGFFAAQVDDPGALQPYDDEVVDAYEIGLKSEFFEGAVRANFSAFYYDYQDLQVYTIVVSPITTLSVQSFTNASNAEIYGAEAELAWTPIENLDLALSASWLEATYQNFQSLAADYSGNTLPNSPETSLTASANYTWSLFGGMANAGMDASYRSKVFYDTRNVERLSDPERTFVNARLGWTTPDEHFEFGVYGRNVFDETNISDIVPIEGLGMDLVYVGPPQSTGVYARFNY